MISIEHTGRGMPARDVPVGYEICGSDRHTRLRCNKVNGQLVLQRIGIEEGQCTDQQLCWPPTDYQGPAEKTRCIGGTPPKGFDENDKWSCKEAVKGGSGWAE